MKKLLPALRKYLGLFSKKNIEIVYRKLRAIVLQYPRQSLLMLVGVSILIVTSVMTYSYLSSQKKLSTTSENGVVSTSLVSKTPEFDTIIPTNTTIEALGGWARVSPPSSDPTFAYVDKIGSIPINVSQQILPKSFEPNVDEKVKELAIGFAANEKISAGKTTVYIGTSINGPQSVIFTKNGLLILIKSSVKITNDRWVAYIESLK